MSGGIVKDSFDFGVNEICNSKNDLEIRLKSFIRPGGGRELIALSFANNMWDIKRYQLFRTGMAGRKLETTSFIAPPPTLDRSIEIRFNMLFDTLKINNIFLLPDQSELAHQMSVFDGTLYVITYKAGRKFRSYRYENPEAYMEHFPDKAEYKELKTIIMALKNFFE